MKTLIISAVFGFLAVALHEFILFLGFSHPWLSWPAGILIFALGCWATSRKARAE